MLSRAVLSQAVAFSKECIDAAHVLRAAVRSCDSRRVPFSDQSDLVRAYSGKSEIASACVMCTNVLYGRARVALCIIHIAPFPTV